MPGHIFKIIKYLNVEWADSIEFGVLYWIFLLYSSNIPNAWQIIKYFNVSRHTSVTLGVPRLLPAPLRRNHLQPRAVNQMDSFLAPATGLLLDCHPVLWTVLGMWGANADQGGHCHRPNLRPQPRISNLLLNLGEHHHNSDWISSGSSWSPKEKRRRTDF